MKISQVRTLPKYQKSAHKRRVNPVTLQVEPYVPVEMIFPRKLLSLGFILFSMSLVIAAIVGTIVYRLVLQSMLGEHELVQEMI